MIAEALLLGSIAGMVYADRRKRKRHLVARHNIVMQEQIDADIEASKTLMEQANIQEALILKHRVTKQGVALYQATRLDYELSDKSETLLTMIMKRVPDSVLAFKSLNSRMPTIDDHEVVTVDDLVFVEALSKCLGGNNKQRPKGRPSLALA
jgi:hypothetical protein